MAPALTETATDGHGVHLSSPLPSSTINADSAMLGKEPDAQPKPAGDGTAQSAWLDRSFLRSSAVCSQEAAGLEDAAYVSPVAPAPGLYKSVLSSSSSLLNILSLNTNRSVAKTPAPAWPRGPHKDLFNHSGVFLLSISERKRKGEAECGEKPSPRPGSGARSGAEGVVNPVNRLSDSDSSAGDQADNDILTPTKINGSLARALRSSTARTGSPAPPWDLCEPGSLLLTGRAAGEEARANGQLCQCLTKHRTLVSRAGEIQKRLQTLLGEHVAQHCSKQLEALREHHFTTSPPAAERTCSPVDRSSFDLSEAETGLCAGIGRPHAEPKPAMFSGCVSEVRKFARCARAALSGVTEMLDPDATDSSSDEEWDPDLKPGAETVPVPRGCEWRWLTDRAEIGSRWTWLQARVSELEFKIQQLTDLHRHLHSTKGRVILADSQPLTDRLVQQMLLTESPGLPRAARDNRTPAGPKDWSSERDYEMEPSSPTLLLRNIERQSAQLTEIVNSLMPPFGFSPSSSPLSKPCKWKGPAEAGPRSELGGGDVFFRGGTRVAPEHPAKKRRVCKKSAKAPHVSHACVSARTRPLRTYLKRRLFVLDVPRQGLCLSSSSSRGSVRGGLMAAELEASLHPILSLASDVPLPLHLQTVLQGEDWVNQPVLPDPGGSEEASSPEFAGAGHPLADDAALSDCTPAEEHRDLPPAGLGTSWPLGRGAKKRRRASEAVEEEDQPLSPLMDASYSLPPTPDDSPSDFAAPRAAQGSRQAAQSSARRRLRSDCFYDIDDIVIPVALAAPAKVERLQYRDILTPSWRVVDMQASEGRLGDAQECEDMSDEAFLGRHVICEKKERVKWRFWDQNRCQRRSSRGSSRSADGPPSANPPDWDCEGRTEPPPGEREDWAWPDRTPWERRAFPLQQCEMEALRPAEEQWPPACPLGAGPLSGTPPVGDSVLHTAQARCSGS
ncbi:KAT8 regulatory NSL complex subunit 1-like protein [Amia ocellicauda]|uniref:KAT8 regulatory NSL complex subunit 1-like protein n=1 Tax=Amia ocellicauda TaxID=2972642 RepID=UPI00346397F4